MADILTPALGESVTEATIAKWSKKSGEAVKRDELLVELETDKVSLEVVAPEDGVLTIEAEEGATVVPGQKLGAVGGGGAAAAPASPAPAKAEAPKPASEPKPAFEPAPAPAAAAPAPAPTPAPAAAAASMPLSPSVQRIVTENKLDPSTIPGTGKDGRITKGDALAAARRGAGARRRSGPCAASRRAPPRRRVPGEREERVR